jgi:hypothetical protein
MRCRFRPWRAVLCLVSGLLAPGWNGCGEPEQPAAPEALSPAAHAEAPAFALRVPPQRNPFGLTVHDVPFDSMQWDRLAWLGIGWARGGAPWWMVHRGPGTFEWTRFDGTVVGAVEHGIEMLAGLSGTPPWVLGVDQVGSWAEGMVPPPEPWAEFVREAVRRYRPGGVLARQRGWPEGMGVHAWEIWNEPDLIDFWKGTAAQYRDVIWLPAVRIIREEDPTAKILLGGLCCFDPGGDDPWKQGGSTAEVLSTPESLAGMDILSVHYYPRSVEQTALLDPYREMEKWLRGVQAFLDRFYGPSGKVVPIWLTETGFRADLFGEDLQDAGIRRLVGRILLSNTNRLVRPQSGLYLLQKFFLFNSISPQYGALGLDPLFRPRRAGLAYRYAVFRAFEVLGLTP